MAGKQTLGLGSKGGEQAGPWALGGPEALEPARPRVRATLRLASIPKGKEDTQRTAPRGSPSREVARRRPFLPRCWGQARRPDSPPLTREAPWQVWARGGRVGGPIPRTPRYTLTHGRRAENRAAGAGGGASAPPVSRSLPDPGAGSPGQGGRRRPSSLSGGGSSGEVDVACTVKHLLRQGPPGREAGGRTQGPGRRVTATGPAFAGLRPLPCFLGALAGGRWPFLWTLGPPPEASGLSCGQPDASCPGGGPGRDPGGGRGCGRGAVVSPPGGTPRQVWTGSASSTWLLGACLPPAAGVKGGPVLKCPRLRGHVMGLSLSPW